MKKLLLSLLIGLLSFISFGYCSTVNDLITNIGDYSYTISGHNFQTVIELNNSSSYGTYCLHINNIGGSLYFGVGNSLNISNPELYYTLYDDWNGVYACVYSSLKYIFLYNNRNSDVSIDFSLFKLNALLNTQIPVMTALECQTNYSLVPESSLSSCQSSLNQCQSSADRLYQDLNNCSSSLSSCQSDLNSASGYVSSLEGELSQCTQDLINCSNSSSGSGDCGSGNVQWSALYVNDIQHLGKPNIFINIPDVIDWDYISTDDDFTLNVSGYAVDTEYIEGVIAVNSYQPTSEDFTNIFVSGLTLVFPYIVIVLFIVFTRKLIKRIFK